MVLAPAMITGDTSFLYFLLRSSLFISAFFFIQLRLHQVLATVESSFPSADTAPAVASATDALEQKYIKIGNLKYSYQYIRTVLLIFRMSYLGIWSSSSVYVVQS